MKKIVVLGSTGSIGTSALDVIRNSNGKFQVVALSGNRNHKLLIEQIKEFSPKYVCVGTEEGYLEIAKEFPEVKLFLGDSGLTELANLKEYDILLTAVSGAIGIEATVAGIKLGKRIALANKETMVAGGEYINRLLKEYPQAEIIPVDSEHSALFQSLMGGEKRGCEKILLLQPVEEHSGELKEEELEKVTLQRSS